MSPYHREMVEHSFHAETGAVLTLLWIPSMHKATGLGQPNSPMDPKGKELNSHPHIQLVGVCDARQGSVEASGRFEKEQAHELQACSPRPRDTMNIGVKCLLQFVMQP